MKKGETIDYKGFHIKRTKNKNQELNYRVVEFGIWFRTLSQAQKMIDTHIKNEQEHNYILVKF